MFQTVGGARKCNVLGNSKKILNHGYQTFCRIIGPITERNVYIYIRRNYRKCLIMLNYGPDFTYADYDSKFLKSGGIIGTNFSGKMALSVR